ncbi:hypothetical protein FTO70_06120 [Methanosarcina sp. KYL-1]|nr:hypothetical protein [Methanosarcina sp. KYL-1]MCQ1535272.1 hypothetical protein [Methanosarcina sp. KYL-1]
MKAWFSKDSFFYYLHEIRFIIVFYVIGDWASTYYAMPFGREFNPLPAMIIEKYGIFYLLILKIVLILSLFLLFPLIKKFPRKWVFTKHIIELLGVMATINNIMVIWYDNSLIQIMGLV